MASDSGPCEDCFALGEGEAYQQKGVSVGASQTAT